MKLYQLLQVRLLRLLLLKANCYLLNQNGHEQISDCPFCEFPFLMKRAVIDFQRLSVVEEFKLPLHFWTFFNFLFREAYLQHHGSFFLCALLHPFSSFKWGFHMTVWEDDQLSTEDS